MPTVFRLAIVLEREKMSQSELARLARLSLQTVNRLCTNRTGQVSLETLDKIADALSVEPGELIVRQPRRRK